MPPIAARCWRTGGGECTFAYALERAHLRAVLHGVQGEVDFRQRLLLLHGVDSLVHVLGLVILVRVVHGCVWSVLLQTLKERWGTVEEARTLARSGGERRVKRAPRLDAARLLRAIQEDNAVRVIVKRERRIVSSRALAS